MKQKIQQEGTEGTEGKQPAASLFSPFPPVQQLESAICRRCRQPFEYERFSRRREYCPRCALQVQRAHAARYKAAQTALKKAGQKSASQGLAAGIAVLRNHPDLRRAFQRWVAAGMPRPQPHEFGGVLLEFQRQVLGWYQRAARLQELGLAREAAQIEREIEPCQKLIGRELAKLHLT